MGSFKSFALAGVFAVAASASSLAADLLPPPPMVPLAPPPLLEASGWYLRGDVGVSAYQRGKFSSTDQPPVQFIQQDFGSGAFAGAGVGYQFNSWFRSDVTAEYRFASNVKAIDRIDFDAGNGLRGVTHEITDGNFSAGVALLNGYIDLGNWHGITPFIGAGVGFAHKRFAGLTDSSITENPIGGVATSSAGFYRDASKTSFAWALHAGLGYDVTPNFKVELAYRYLNLGEGRTGELNCFCGQTFTPLKVKDLESHDIKIGFRWLLGAPAPAPIPVELPAPIIRKY
jgi:opacity protein-like surface antigen